MMMSLGIDSSTMLTFQLKFKFLATLKNKRGGTYKKIREPIINLKGPGPVLAQGDEWSGLRTEPHSGGVWVMEDRSEVGKAGAWPTDSHVRHNEVCCLTHTICIHFRLMWTKYETRNNSFFKDLEDISMTLGLGHTKSTNHNKRLTCH